VIRLLTPSIYIRSVTDLDPSDLFADGIRAMLLDLDNTLVAWGATEPEPRMLAWVARLKEVGLRACIVSNGFSRRTIRLSTVFGLPAVGPAAKPSLWGLRRAMALLQTPASQTALVGDQLFTDVLAGNLLHLRTILVEPLSSREFITTRIMRLAERLVRRRLLQTHIT